LGTVPSLGTRSDKGVAALDDGTGAPRASEIPPPAAIDNETDSIKSAIPHDISFLLVSMRARQ